MKSKTGVINNTGSIRYQYNKVRRINNTIKDMLTKQAKNLQNSICGKNGNKTKQFNK